MIFKLVIGLHKKQLQTKCANAQEQSKSFQWFRFSSNLNVVIKMNKPDEVLGLITIMFY